MAILLFTAFLGALSLALAVMPLGWLASFLALPVGGSLGALLWAVLVVLPRREPKPPKGTPAEDARRVGN